MSFPARSNFASAEGASAWYLLNVGGRYQLCATTGGAFIRALQRELRATPGGPSFDGTQVSGSSVAIDGKWGPTTQRVLWRALRQLNIDPTLLTIVAYDAGWRGSTRVLATPHLSRGSLLAAVWLLARLGPPPLTISPQDVRVPNDAGLPVWNLASSNGTDELSTCSVATNAFAAGVSTYPTIPAGATAAINPPSATPPASSSPSGSRPTGSTSTTSTTTTHTTTTPASTGGSGTAGGTGSSGSNGTLTLPTGFETQGRTPSSTPWILLGALGLTVGGFVVLRRASFALQERRLATASAHALRRAAPRGRARARTRR